MPTFTISSPDPQINASSVEAETWAEAVSIVLQRSPDEGDATTLHVKTEGQIEVLSSAGAHRFTLILDLETGIGTSQALRTEFLDVLSDVPSPANASLSARDASFEDGERAYTEILEIVQAEDKQAACEAAIQAMMRLIPAESCSVLLKEGDHLRFVAVGGPKASALLNETLSTKQGIASAVLRSGSTLLVQSAQQHAEHSAQVDEKVDHVTKTLLAIPIKKASQPVGVVELLNPFGSDTFTTGQQDVASQIANALAQRL